jgi:hypothetical protein
LSIDPVPHLVILLTFQSSLRPRHFSLSIPAEVCECHRWRASVSIVANGRFPETLARDGGQIPAQASRHLAWKISVFDLGARTLVEATDNSRRPRGGSQNTADQEFWGEEWRMPLHVIDDSILTIASRG